MTSKYIDIIKCCNKLKKIQKEKDKNELIENLEFHIRTLMFNYNQKARQINGRPIKCIRERMNGKDGLFRNNLSGKRGDFTARSVIGPDPRLRADQISIPEEFAKKITFPEIVNAINYNKMQEIVNNNRANYVKRENKTYDLKYNIKKKYIYETGFLLEEGDIVLRDGKKIDPVKYKQAIGKDIVLVSTDKVARNGKIIKNIKPIEKVTFELEYNDVIVRDNRQIKFDSSNKDLVLREGDKVFRCGIELRNIKEVPKRNFLLKYGDVVERHIVDGDIVLFGRQPTLHKGSMIARKIKIYTLTILLIDALHLTLQ